MRYYSGPSTGRSQSWVRYSMRSCALYSTARLCVLLWFLGGCGEDGTDGVLPPPAERPGVSDSDGGVRSEPLDSGVADGLLSPQITILGPASEPDPSGDQVLTERTVTVTCQVKPAASAKVDVDVESIAIHMHHADGDVITATALDALPDDVYQTEFTLSSLPNGALSFSCEASSRGGAAERASATVETFLDLGPELEVISPIEDSIHALKSPVSIEFFARPAKVSDDDPSAEVAAVEVSIPGARKPLVAAPDSTQPGRYSLQVDFDDRNLFGAPPETAEIILKARNSRGAGVVRSERIHIALDAVGPTIIVHSPVDRQVTRGEVTVRVEVSDPSGVRNDALTVIIDDKDPDKRLVIADWEIDGSTFQQQFDTRHFADTRTQLTLNLRARDSVGNQSSAEVTIRLDNLPPLLSLDPPPIREWYDVDNDKDWCTEPFDPVGDLAANDLAVVPEAVLFRALVWDQTNGAEGNLARWYAGMDETSVQLFYRPADGTPLLIDNTDDDDDRCNEINYSDFTPTISAGQDPRFYQFEPLSPHGSAPPDHAFEAPDPYCLAAPPLSNKAADPRCDNSEMTRVAPQPLEDKPSGVYAFKPTDSTTSTCDGDTVALGQNVQPGWVCLSLRARDTIGNVGVSRPLRVCLQDPASCADPPPTCTDGCALPDDLAEGLTLRYR